MLIEDWSKSDLVDEILHFQEVASLILPRKEYLPKLENIDYYGAIEPYKGCVSGDHLIIINFDDYHLDEKIKKAKDSGNNDLVKRLEKNFDAFGILIADVAGHMVTDNISANYLHAAFKTGVAYELAYNGEVTPGLFEMLNTDFYNHIRPEFLLNKPFVTLIYGEMHKSGIFRFLSAGHPPPIIFSSKYNKIMLLENKDVEVSTPLGVIPSRYNLNTPFFDSIIPAKDNYSINEITLLGKGDILTLYTDGLIEQDNGEKNFVESRLEQVLKENKEKTAKEIYQSIRQSLEAYCPPSDDLTILIVKKL